MASPRVHYLSENTWSSGYSIVQVNIYMSHFYVFHNECPTNRDVLQNFPVFFFSRSGSFLLGRQSIRNKDHGYEVELFVRGIEVLGK